MGVLGFLNDILGSQKPVEQKSVPAINPFSFADRGGMPKAYIPNFLYRPPFGYPRYINVPNIRRLAAMPYVEMCIRTIIAECQAVPWDIVVNKDYEFTEGEIESKQQEIREVKNFFRNPNTDKESFEQIDSKITRDVLEVEAGVMVKIFNKAGEMVEIVARDGGLFTKNPDVYGKITNRDDIIFAQMAETYDEREGKLPPGYIGANDMREKAAYFQYGWMASGRPVPFGKREIIWFEQNVRSDDIYGRSPIENLMKTIQMLIYAIDNNLEYFTDNSIPKGIIGMEGASSEEIEAFKQTWREQQKKLDEYGNWRKVFWNPPIINSKPAFEKIEWSAAELQLIEQQKWFSRLVWASFGVTPSELGYTEDTNNATEIIQSRVFKRKAINPILKMKEWKYNHELLIEWREKSKSKSIATHMQETESEYIKKKLDIEQDKEKKIAAEKKSMDGWLEMKSRYENDHEINEYAVEYMKAKEEVNKLADEGKLPFYGIEFKYLMFDVDEETKKWELYKMQLETKAKTINDILKQEGETPVDWGDQPSDYTPSMNLNGLGFGTNNGQQSVGTQKPGTQQDDGGRKPFGQTNNDIKKEPTRKQENKSGAMEDYHFQPGNLSKEGQEYFEKCLQRNINMGMNKQEAEQNAWAEIRNMGLKSGGTEQLKYAHERFDLSNAKLLNRGGSDRSAYEMPDGKILKIVKSARGLGQNEMEGIIKLVPKLFEKGKDYVLVEKCDRDDARTESLLAGLQRFTSEDWKCKTKDLLDEIDRIDKQWPESGFKEILNYDIIFGDLKKAKNWGWSWRPYLIDAGTLNREELDESFIEHLRPEWFEIVKTRREARDAGTKVLMKAIETKPFAGYSDFADCVAKNKDKDDPDAYCATIMRSVEGKADHFELVNNGTNKEMLRSSIVSELSAISLYEDMASKTDNPKLKKMFLDIAQEEKVHVGEFEALLIADDMEQGSSLIQGAVEAANKVSQKGHLAYDPNNENFDPKRFDDLYTRGIKKKNPLIIEMDEKPSEEKLIGALHFILDENEKKIIKLISQEVRPNKVGEIKSLADIINSIKNLLMLGGAKDVSDAVIMTMFMDGWDKTEKQLQRNLNLNREAIDFIKKYTFENIEGMTKELVEDLRQELERGLIEGEGAFKLTERVHKIFEMSKSRAEAIARTETNRAENQGRLLAFKESGEEYEKKWISHVDDRTSDFCKRMNGKTVGLNEQFKDSQTNWEGMAPPGHVNCRSQVVFVPKSK